MVSRDGNFIVIYKQAQALFNFNMTEKLSIMAGP